MNQPKIKSINHIAIVVEDISEALKFWRDTLGLELSHKEDIPAQDSRIAFLPLAKGAVELVEPTTEESGIARFLKSSSTAMHHICLEVDDIEAMLAHLKSKDIRLIDETPQTRDGRKIAFIHPESTYGVLVELYQLQKD
jgi:methylmalonyl-CoA/ethylmalonyl-CoA epimerase